MFRTIWVHSGPFGCLTKLGAKWACKSSCHEVASEFYATNTADPPHWTLYRRFGAYHTWMHSGPFGCPTKLGAKRTELVQKFLPRSRVGIFRKRTHPIHPVDPKGRFGAFRSIWVHFRNERTRSTQSDPKLMFWCVSYYLVVFGTVGLN